MPVAARLPATLALLAAGWFGWQALAVPVNWLGLGAVDLLARTVIAFLVLALADHLAGMLRARLSPHLRDPE